MAEVEEVWFRLLRADARPPSGDADEAFVFGLQDAGQQLAPPTLRADGGLAFDFALRAKPSRDPVHPTFVGNYASGPPHDRFVYLAWRSVARGVWINRVKARLSSIEWALVRASQAAGRPIEADMTGWTPHDRRKAAPWRLAET